MVKVPTFTMTLPVSKETITYRPFLVKEEKVLILANESDDMSTVINAIDDVTKNCTDHKVGIETHCMADVQYAFLQIRGKSIGEDFTFYSVCGECQHKHVTTMRVDEFEVEEGTKNNVIVLDGGLKVELKYPGLQHYALLFDTEDESKVYEVVAECIVKIYNEEEVFVNTTETTKDMLEFLDGLTPAQFEQFEKFFVDMPVLFKRFTFTCENCNVENKLTIDGITSFFD